VAGSQLLATLELYGFTIIRRSKRFVWVGRGNDVLMLDLDGDIDDDVAEQILERARKVSTQP
jgi:hypothetical protein